MNADHPPEMTPAMRNAFAALREEMTAADQPDTAMVAARMAMHQARVAHNQRRPALIPSVLASLRHAITPRRLAAVALPVGAALAVVSVIGWNAPAGSPLHVVRVTREQVAMAVPGVDRVGLELSDAESRLQDAARGTDVANSLSEATRLLGDARAHLPNGPASRWWRRWQDDERWLDSLQSPSDAHESPAAPSNGGAAAAGTPPAGVAPGSGDAESGTTGGGESTGSGGSTPGGGGHDGGTSTTTTTSSSDGGQRSTTTTATTSSDGGGHDGGSSTSSTSTSDGGGSSSSSTSDSSSGH